MPRPGPRGRSGGRPSQAFIEHARTGRKHAAPRRFDRSCTLGRWSTDCLEPRYPVMNPSHFRPTGRLLGALALARLVCGCASIPNGRAAVDSVDLHGARQLDSSDVTDELATAPSPKFLGLFRGVLY